MIFRQSAVTHLDRHEAVETSHNLPRDIHPALIGSGRIAMGLDATGFQGLNWSLWQYVDSAAFESGDFPIEKNLHLYRDSVLSQHTLHNPRSPGQQRNFANMPCGWTEYVLTVGGRRLDTAAQLAEGTGWKRVHRPREGVVVTSYEIAGIRVEWTAAMAVDAPDLALGFRADSLDGRHVEVGLELVCHWTLRYGGPVFKGGWAEPVREPGLIFAHWTGNNETATAYLKRPVNLGYAWIGPREAVGERKPDSLHLSWRGQGVKVAARFALLCGSSLEGNDTPDFARQVQSQLASGLEQARASWLEFFAEAAEIGVGSPEKEYLTALNQYVLKAGLPWHSGLPLGTLWTKKFGSSTFWDSFFACDGMLRAGHVQTVRSFCEWLVKTARPKGRPHMWITFFDGDTPCDPEGDVAYFNCLAYAGCGIRLYEMTRDEADLRQRVFPYLSIICNHLLDRVFEQTAAGEWQLGGTIAGDIEAYQTEARTQKDILIWSVLTLAKFSEYAVKLGVETPAAARAEAIAAYFRKHPVVMDTRSNWYPWLPYLAPALPFADFTRWWDGSEAVFQKVMIAPHDEDLGERIYGSRKEFALGPLMGTYLGMGWCNTSNAAAATIAGQPDVALEFQDGALKYVSGLGYLTESPYDLQAGGNSPYVPASGSFLSSILVMCAQSDLFGGELRVGVDMPRFWKFNRVWFRNVRAFNGARVGARYTPHDAEYVLDLPRAMKVRLQVPARIAGEPLKVCLGGARLPHAAAAGAIVLDLSAGRHTVSVERDLAQPFDVTVVESFDHGEALCEAARAGGLKVRWLRDFDGLSEAAASTGRSLVINGHFVRVFPDQVRVLEREVRAGKTLVCLYHAGVERYCPELAGLTGVNAQIDSPWCFEGKTAMVCLTPAGRRQFPQLKERLAIETCAIDFKARLAPETQVLGVIEGSGEPFLTCRPVGAGRVWWIASGAKMMNRPWSLGWGLHLTREVFVYGRTRDSMASRPWLQNPDFAAVLQAVLKG